MLQLLSIADASTMTGKGQGTAGWSATLQDSVKIRRLLRKNTQTWVLSSGANLYCVQTLKGRFDEAEIAAKFGL